MTADDDDSVARFNNLDYQNLKPAVVFFLALFLVLSAASAFADPIVDTRGDLYSISAIEYFLDFLPALVLEAITITLLVRKDLRAWISFLLLWIAVTNVTWFGLNAVLTIVRFPTPSQICLGELAVVAVETFVLRAILKRPRFVLDCARSPTWSRCLGISVLGNVVSLVAGYALHSV